MVEADLGTLALHGFLPVLLLAVTLFGLAVPIVVWIERRQAALVEDRSGFGPANPDGVVWGGMVQIFADFLKLSAKRWTIPAEANRFLFCATPWLVVTSGLLSFAVVPVAGRYTFGNSRISLILADLEVGVLYILVLGSLAGLGMVWTGIASGNPWARRSGLRAAAHGLSSDLALLFSLAPVLLIYGTLRLGEMAEWQDSTVGVWSWLRIFVESDSVLRSGGFSLPAWGLFLNPLAWVLFLMAATARAGLPPFDADRAGGEFGSGLTSSYSGSALLLFSLAEKFQIVLIAALLTLIFLGGWSIPWVPQNSIVEPISGYVGAGVANAVCMMLHLVSFASKWLAMVFLQLLIRSSLPRYSSQELMALCWKFILPLSVVNFFATAGVLLALRGAFS